MIFSINKTNKETLNAWILTNSCGISAQSEDEEEDSAEEIFTAPGTSAGRSSDNLLKPNSVYENTTISTDFTSILDTVNKN